MKTKNQTTNHSLNSAVCAGALLLLAVSASGQNLFVSNTGNGNIYEITPGGVQTTFASGLNHPLGMAFNSAGDLFVANSADNGPGSSIVEITPGGVQSTFASGVDPQGLAFNSAGNLFEVDYESGNVYEFTPGGAQSTFASGLSFPLSMTFNSAGDLFVGAGYGVGNGYIEEITPSGSSSVFASGLGFPEGLAFNSSGDLFVANTAGNDIYEYTPGGVQSTFASVTSPNGLAFNNAGDLFVTSAMGDNVGGSIIEITPGGVESTVVAQPNIAAGVAFQPVPEPSAMALVGMGAAAFFARRRRQ